MGSLLGREHSPPPTSRNECPHGRKTHLVLFPISAFNCSVLECVCFCSHLDSYWFRHLTNAANRTFGVMAHGALPAGSPVSSHVVLWPPWTAGKACGESGAGMGSGPSPGFF